MTSSTLIGRNKATEAEVFNVPEAVFTRTFKPFHHREIINAIKTGITAVGLEVDKTEYVLANEGKRMFGVFDINSGTDELCWSMGIRNSMDKSMALGVCAGTRVFVCENLAFDSEFLALRKHTSGLTLEELEFMAYRAIRCLVNGRLTKFQAWHENLKMHELSERDAKVLLVEAITQSVFPASKLPMFCDLYFGGVYDATLWGFHESVTQVLKEANLLTLPKKNRILNAILNQHIESLHDELPSSLGEFYEQRSRYYQPRLIS